MSLFQKSSKQVFSIYWEVTKAWRGLTSLNEKCSKVNCHFLGQWLRRVRHAETDRAEKKESKGHSALLWAEAKERAKAHRAIRPYCVWVPERAKHRKERASAGCAVRRNREKHNESMSEWKRKRRHFSLLKLHTRKINWWSFHGVFGCYNHGELEYSDEDFTTGFVVRLYLLLEIYLLYIQFIVNSSLA